MDKARQPMSFGRLPISPSETETPIIPVNKWVKKDNKLQKKFEFMSKDMRNDFVTQLFDHEEEVGHHAKFSIDEDHVIVTLQTRDVEQITELDKEYAKFADVLYKDVVYQVPEKKSIKPNIIKSSSYNLSK